MGVAEGVDLVDELAAAAKAYAEQARGQRLPYTWRRMFRGGWIVATETWLDEKTIHTEIYRLVVYRNGKLIGSYDSSYAANTVIRPSEEVIPFIHPDKIERFVGTMNTERR